jgi:hypothetical protein
MWLHWFWRLLEWQQPAAGVDVAVDWPTKQQQQQRDQAQQLDEEQLQQQQQPKLPRRRGGRAYT